MYGETNKFLNDVEATKSHAFDNIFKIDDPITITNCSVCDPWWTPKNSHKVQISASMKEM